jgi:hypothetical protein
MNNPVNTIHLCNHGRLDDVHEIKKLTTKELEMNGVAEDG